MRQRRSQSNNYSARLFEEIWVKRMRVPVEAAGYRWQQHTQWHAQVFGGLFRVDVYFKSNGSCSARRLGEPTDYIGRPEDIIKLAGACQPTPSRQAATRPAATRQAAPAANRPAGGLPPLSHIRTPEAVAQVQSHVRRRYGDDNPFAMELLRILSKRLASPIWLRDQ